MVYYKITLNDKRQTQDEIYSIVVRITSNKKNTTFTTGVRVKKKYWDDKQRSIKSTEANYLELNNKINTYFNRLQKAVLKLEDENRFSFENLRIELIEKQLPPKQVLKERFDIFAVSVIKELHELNKAGNALVYQTAWNRFHSYMKNKPFTFNDIDYNCLEGFKKHLILQNASVNTISNYLRTLRAIYNRGIKARLVDRATYPFQDIKIKSERTSKRAVKLTDIARLKELDLSHGETAWHSRNYFLLSISLIGISFTDLAYLKPSNIVKGRLIYRRRKTHKEYNIMLTPISKTILKHYQGSSSKYLLPVLPVSIIEDSVKAHALIKQFIKTTNKYLRRMATELKIDELTTYGLFK
jgi:integrase/recombinase XerD